MLINTPTFLILREDNENESQGKRICIFRKYDVTANFKDVEKVKTTFSTLIIIDRILASSKVFIGYNSAKNQLFMNFPIMSDSVKGLILKMLNTDISNTKSVLRKIGKLKREIIDSQDISLFRIRGNRYFMGDELVKTDNAQMIDISDLNKNLYLDKIFVPLFSEFLQF